MPSTKHNLTFNDSKCVFALDTINLLGYRITNGKLQPDPERIKPSMELPIPGNAKALQRIIGMFAYYARWILRYSETIKPFLAVKRFPLCEEAVAAFDSLKTCLSTVTLGTIDERLRLPWKVMHPSMRYL